MSSRKINIALSWAVLGIFLCACAPRPAATRDSDHAARDSVGAPAIVRGNASGMEVRWWFADDTSGRVGALLAPYGGAGGDLRFADAGDLAGNGVRIVRVPLGEALALTDAIGTLGSRNRTWIPASGTWSEAYRGRRVAENVPVLLGGRRERLARGMLRVLGRAWLAQTLDGPVLRADFATQLTPPASRPAEGVFESPAFETEIEKGEVLGSLSFGAVLEEGFVYVITCEEPGVAWESADGEAEVASDAPVDSSGEPSLPEVQPGPPARRPLTAGEVMFSARAEETGGRVIKSVVMVIPRVGG